MWKKKKEKLENKGVTHDIVISFREFSHRKLLSFYQMAETNLNIFPNKTEGLQ